MLVRRVLTHTVAGGCCPLQCVHNIYCPDSIILFVCRRAMTEKASATVPSLSVSSWSSGSKGSCSMSPPSTSKGWGKQGARSTKTHLMHLLGSSLHNCPFSVCFVESQQICTTLLRGHTLLSWPSTGRSRPISTRLRSSWRKRSVLQSNSTGRVYNSYLRISD